MKLILVLLCIGIAACSTPAKVTQRADLTPVRTSNEATRKNIKANKERLEASQKDSKQGQDSLKEAKIILEGLL